MSSNATISIDSLINFLQSEKAKQTPGKGTTTKTAKTAPATKGVTPAKKVVKKQSAPAPIKKQVVKQSPRQIAKPNGANVLEIGESEQRNVTEGVRIRLYAKDFVNGKCTINGIPCLQSANDGKGRFTVSSFAERGDVIELTKTGKGTFDAVNVSNKKRKPAPVPAKTTVKKVVAKSPVKVTAKKPAIVAKKVVKSPAKTSASVKQPRKVAKLELPAKSKGTAKTAKVETKKVVKVKQIAEKSAGDSKEFKTAVGLFKRYVGENKSEGFVNDNPNCPYTENDGRRFLKRQQRKEFNHVATAAGFYGLDGLAKAGEMIMA